MANVAVSESTALGAPSRQLDRLMVVDDDVPLALRKRLNPAVGPSSALLVSNMFTLLATARLYDLMASRLNLRT